MDIDEPLLSRSPGGFSSPSTSRSSRPHIKREFPSGFLDLPLPTPRGRQSTAHLLSTSDVIIPIIATAAASHPSSGSYVNLIANLNERRRLTHRSNSSPAVFTDAKESISRPMDPRPARKSNPFIVRQAFIGLILYVIIGVVVFLVSGNFKGHETYKPVDALYFTVVTLCTIGYGDIVPDTTFTKLFTCAFIIIGFGFVDILLNGLVTYICDRQEAVMLGTVDESRFNTMVRAYMVDAAKGRMRIRLKVAIALMIPVCCIAVGTIAIRYLESLPWVDSFYMAVTSVTTVGYGDFSFTTVQGRVFAIIWLLVSTLTVARAFLYLTELRIDKRNRRIAKWVLQKKMTLGDLIAADLDHDGSISKSEFVIYKLKEMGKIAQKDIMQICDQFDLLDHTKNGKITLADLMDSD
ncbi:two-pore potassium channel 3-like isoform X1 [Punica granatum]|uniref:Two-pore potassium channel 3-like isoform X1 n=2 Tax=Punica granatum TaxID=22663 RepID=A0A6P8D428_PUNGR|nr:two-pore potassium channel 3-like isoform X1 [Punica granatum]PKI55696.1 hypothetical protein CRG98_023912 [Punica granatum]